MRIAILEDHKLTDAIAGVYKSNKTGKRYFCVKIGDRNTKEHSMIYTMSINSKLALPEKDDDIYLLDKKTYGILPMRRNNTLVQNKRGEQLYSIIEEKDIRMESNYILFWKIPAIRCTPGSINYKLNGDIELLGTGQCARDRGDTTFINPIPVLELYGNAELTWEAINIDGKKQGQTIKFDIVADKFTFTYHHANNNVY